MLRRVNAGCPRRCCAARSTATVGKRFLASQVLGDQDPERIRVPGPARPGASEVTARQVAELDDAGYPVEGTLHDLRCPELGLLRRGVAPAERDVAASAVTALARVLVLRSEERRDEGPRPARCRPLARRLRGSAARRLLRFQPLRPWRVYPTVHGGAGRRTGR